MARRNEKLYHIYYGMKARCYNPIILNITYMVAKVLKFVTNGIMTMKYLKNGHLIMDIIYMINYL